jgi:hypothetical protein
VVRLPADDVKGNLLYWTCIVVLGTEVMGFCIQCTWVLCVVVKGVLMYLL